MKGNCSCCRRALTRASRSGARSRLITHVCKPSIDEIVREGPAAEAGLNAAWIGWALAAAALAAGYVGYGWRGVVLALSVVVFWLLLQFSRSVRALRDATGRPVGNVASAVMLHARLHAGMRLPEVLKLTRSLGRHVSDEPETWAWADAGGDEVQVVLTAGRVSAWDLKRPGS